MSTFRSDPFGHQRADELFGIDRSGRMVLEGIDMGEFGADSIRYGESVAGRAVMIARREPLDVQPADPAGGQNDGLRGDDDEAIVVQVPQHGTGTGAVAV